MIDYHRVPAEQFAALGTGLGGPEAVRGLAAAQRSKRLLMLRMLSQAGGNGSATEVLIEADRRNHDAVATLIGDPLVGAWIAWTVRRHLGQTESAVPLADDLAQLGAVAAVAAMRAGMDVQITTRARNGGVTLPTLGTAVLERDGSAVVAVKGDAVRVTESVRWHPLRRLTAHHDGRTGTLLVEDGNPYRNCYHAPPEPRLSDDEVDRWQASYADAWSLLAGYAPARADELAAGLVSIVPLITEEESVARSGTARDAFGTMGLTRPRSATEFAVTLVHEFQHSKLSALLDLVPLYETGGDEQHFAPWRVDARPTAGLIQGVYAFLGVADTWRTLRDAPGLESEAAREFAVFRLQVDVGLSALEGSGELTVQGFQFAAAMRAALDEMLAEKVPPSATSAAEETLARRRRAWETHNGGVASSTASTRR